jgi:hypothetical protein
MLQTEVTVLGVGHPTGYPTYMMLTHLFTFLPIGDPAYRVNLASAIYGAAAVFAVYLAGLRLGGKPVAAAAGALAFGLSGAFWSQAVIAEVYTFEALLRYAGHPLLVPLERPPRQPIPVVLGLSGRSLPYPPPDERSADPRRCGLRFPY